MSHLILVSFGLVKLFPSASSRRSIARITPELGGGVTTAGGRCGTGACFAPTHFTRQAAR